MLTLVRRSIDRATGMFVSIAAVLVAFQFALIAIAASYAERGDFERLTKIVPAFFRSAFGPSLRSFAGMTTISYFEPLPVMLVVLFAVYVASEPAGDVEAHLVDLVLARPVPRSRLVTRTLIVVATFTLGLMLTLGLSTWVGLSWLAPANAEWPAVDVLMLLMIYLTAVAWAFSAIALAVAAWCSRRAATVGPVAIATVALYLLEVLGHSWQPARLAAFVSPFHYFPGPSVIDGGTNVALNLGVLGAITIAAIATAYWQFGRRDL